MSPRIRRGLWLALLPGIFVPVAASAEPAAGYWQALKWEYRPLVMLDGADRRADDWEGRLAHNRCALAERRIHWLTVRPDGSVWRRFDGGQDAAFEQTRLDGAAATDIRRRVGWQAGSESRLLLFGLDGQRKYAGQPESLDTIWALIDRMPMRRAELEREPDRCRPR